MKQGIIVCNSFSCVHMSAQSHLTTLSMLVSPEGKSRLDPSDVIDVYFDVLFLRDYDYHVLTITKEY